MQFIAFGKPGKQEDIPNIEKKKKTMENPKKKYLSYVTYLKIGYTASLLFRFFSSFFVFCSPFCGVYNVHPVACGSLVKDIDTYLDFRAPIVVFTLL
jgi:hypothetical protein